MISMRPWPNAPRDCLLLSTPCSEVTCVASSVMFFCALSMTASRSLSFCRFSVVLCLVFSVFVFSAQTAEPVRDRIEPLIDGVLKLRLAAGEHADHGFEPRRRIGLRPRQFGHDRRLRLGGMARPPQHK